jgi:hypothetical protein
MRLAVGHSSQTESPRMSSRRKAPPADYPPLHSRWRNARRLAPCWRSHVLHGPGNHAETWFTHAPGFPDHRFPLRRSVRRARRLFLRASALNCGTQFARMFSVKSLGNRLLPCARLGVLHQHSHPRNTLYDHPMPSQNLQGGQDREELCGADHRGIKETPPRVVKIPEGFRKRSPPARP